MCLIAWNWQPASAAPLVLIANRDEFYARPTAALHWWKEADILAGRDLQAGGTWLGVSRDGRLAALTNYRDPMAMRSNAPSRGPLVSAFLQSQSSAQDYLAELVARSAVYNPFNLLVFDGNKLMGLESRHQKIVAMSPGLGAVSNADFATPWPKLARLQDGLHALLAQGHASDEQLLALLHNPTTPPDTELPETGLPLIFERALSAAFVATPDYGTRASSVVRLAGKRIEFLEQGFDAHGPTQRRHIKVPEAASRDTTEPLPAPRSQPPIDIDKIEP